AESLVPEDREVPVDAEVTFDEETQSWTAVPGRPGQGVDPAEFVETVSTQAPKLTDFSVQQSFEDIAPAITTEEAEDVVGTIASGLEQPMSITGSEGETHEVSSERRNAWLSVGPDEAGQALEISVDEESVRDWVTERADQESV